MVRFIDSPKFLKRDAQVRQHEGARLRCASDILVILSRAFEILLAQQNKREVPVQVGIAGIDLRRQLKLVNGIREVSLLRQRERDEISCATVGYADACWS